MSPVELYRAEKARRQQRMEALFAEIRPLLDPPPTAFIARLAARNKARAKVPGRDLRAYNAEYYERNRDRIRKRQQERRGVTPRRRAA